MVDLSAVLFGLHVLRGQVRALLLDDLLEVAVLARQLDDLLLEVVFGALDAARGPLDLLQLPVQLFVLLFAVKQLFLRLFC